MSKITYHKTNSIRYPYKLDSCKTQDFKLFLNYLSFIGISFRTGLPNNTWTFSYLDRNPHKDTTANWHLEPQVVAVIEEFNSLYE